MEDAQRTGPVGLDGDTVRLDLLDGATVRLPVVTPAAPGHSPPSGDRTLKRAVVLMTASSILPPVAGLLTQPVLAQALGVDGRGVLAAALAPAVLALSAATLGLPEALTFYLAKYPQLTRRALVVAGLISLTLGAVCFLLAWLALPFLSAGDPQLGDLILLALGLTVPALLVGALRGAASGRQMWGAIARERLVNTVIRIGLFPLLWVTGTLTVLTAVLVSVLSPIVAGVVYWRLLRRPTERSTTGPGIGTSRLLVSFGRRTWIGAVASMMLGRVAQILMVPLSDARELGLYVVASTVADVPLIVAIAIRDALYGVNSKEADAERLTVTTRLTLLVGFVGCTLMAATLPWWLAPLFGADFAGALVPSLMLLFSALVCIPGLLASSALAAWGRPGLRSVGLTVTLVVNVGVLVLLVPPFGVYGASWTSIVSNVLLTGFMMVSAARVMGVPVGDFVLVRGSDIALLRRQLAGVTRQIGRRVR